MTTRPRALDPDQLLPSPEDYDADGRFLYPGDVEDAMPEGDLGFLQAKYLLETLRRLVVDPARSSAYANMPIYYRKGEPKRHVAPDAFYLQDVPYERGLRSYCLWKTDVPPRVVFEVVSRGHEHKDVERNRELYAELGVAEYYWFNPDTGELMALRLDAASGRFVPAPGSGGRFPSPALGLEVGTHRGEIRLFRDGSPIAPSEDLLEEANRQREEANRQREEADRRLEEAERRIAELERHLDRGGS